MLVIISMDEIYNAIPMEVGTKSTWKITLPGGKGIGENLTTWRKEQASGED